MMDRRDNMGGIRADGRTDQLIETVDSGLKRKNSLSLSRTSEEGIADPDALVESGSDPVLV